MSSARRTLKLSLLGPPQVWLGEELLTQFRTSKTQALLYFLATTNRMWQRSSLAGLLWGDMSDRQAHVNLSKSLSELRRELVSHISIDHRQVSLDQSSDFWLDVAVFDAASASPVTDADTARLAQAVELVRGDFLQGFNVSNAPEFEYWMVAEQERLHQRVLTALDALTGYARAKGRLSDGIVYARRALALDPLHEPGHRHLMALLAASGQRGAALQQFEKLRQLFDTELGSAPSPETVEMVRQIQAGNLPETLPQSAILIAEPHRLPAGPDASPSHAHHLPLPATVFIGRAKELADIRRLLAEPDCRSLTLVGPGGMGKTRLAIQAAHQVANSSLPEYVDGVYFVALAAATDVNGMAATIAQAMLDGSFDSGLSPQQLVGFLREKRILLVLDNLEHLNDAAGLLTELLSHAPGVKLLATSREALKLPEAWLYPVGGLPVAKEGGNYPGTVDAGQEVPDAVRLFLAVARRKQPDFAPARHAAAVEKVCRLVGGMPLALELAAAWTNVMPPQAIADALQQGLDILTARHAAISLRHRSIRVVLEESWWLLSPTERAIFDRLAVFRGGFQPEAGAAVIGASPSVLAGLVDRLLITLDATGRFQIHELLHQFAEEHLAADQAQWAVSHSLHSRFYLDLLAKQYQLLVGGEPQAALESVRVDFDNIAAAWQWAIGREEYTELGRSVVPFFEFCWVQGRLKDGVALLSQLADALAVGECLQPHRAVYGRVLACVGVLLCHLERGEEGLACVRRSLEFAEADADRAFALVQLGSGLCHLLRTLDATVVLREGVSLYQKTGDPAGLARALSLLANAMQSQGDREAQRVGREAVAAGRRTGRRDLIAFTLGELGWIDWCCGDYELALADFREALAIAEQLGYRFRIAWALENSAWIYMNMNKPVHPDTLPYLERAMAIYRELGMLSWVSLIMAERAVVLYDMGQVDLAVASAREGADMAREEGNRHFLGHVSAYFGDILTRSGAYSEAHQMLEESLATTYSIRNTSMTLIALCYLGELLMAESRQADFPAQDAHLRQAAQLLTIVTHHPAAWQFFKDKAARLLATLDPAYLPADDSVISLDTMVSRLLSASEDTAASCLTA